MQLTIMIEGDAPNSSGSKNAHLLKSESSPRRFWRLFGEGATIDRISPRMEQVLYDFLYTGQDMALGFPIMGLNSQCFLLA